MRNEEGGMDLGSASALGCGSTRPRVEHVRTFRDEASRNDTRGACAPRYFIREMRRTSQNPQAYARLRKATQTYASTSPREWGGVGKGS
jgi:hypothetical protein